MSGDRAILALRLTRDENSPGLRQVPPARIAADQPGPPAPLPAVVQVKPLDIKAVRSISPPPSTSPPPALAKSGVAGWPASDVWADCRQLSNPNDYRSARKAFVARQTAALANACWVVKSAKGFPADTDQGTSSTPYPLDVDRELFRADRIAEVEATGRVVISTGEVLGLSLSRAEKERRRSSRWRGSTSGRRPTAERERILVQRSAIEPDPGIGTMDIDRDGIDAERPSASVESSTSLAVARPAHPNLALSSDLASFVAGLPTFAGVIQWVTYVPSDFPSIERAEHELAGFGQAADRLAVQLEAARERAAAAAVGADGR